MASPLLRRPISFCLLSKMCRVCEPVIAHPGITAAALPTMPAISWQQHRGIKKHYHPKFRWLRGKKMIKVDLPNFNEDKEMEKMTPDEMRRKLKEKGILPPRPWSERSISISATGGVFEEYVPPEGDGKASIVSTSGAKQRLQRLEKKGRSMMAVRKIRSYDELFDVEEFAEQALEIYRRAHEALTVLDKVTLHETVTELAYPKMVQNVRHKTVRWRLLSQLEPARVVHVRCTDIINKENVYAQVTVRLHTQQILAIYDRFGRLMYGSEVVAKDVLEYIVFEKHLANVYGQWRIHSKIIPDWMPTREPVTKTWVQPETTEKAEEDEGNVGEENRKEEKEERAVAN